MAKARRRAGISVLIMLIGFMTIAGVIVYRLSTMSSADDARYATETIVAPAGAEIISAHAQDGTVTLTYRQDTVTTIRIYDGRSGAVIGEIMVVAE